MISFGRFLLINLSALIFYSLFETVPLKFDQVHEFLHFLPSFYGNFKFSLFFLLGNFFWVFISDTEMNKNFVQKPLWLVTFIDLLLPKLKSTLPRKPFGEFLWTWFLFDGGWNYVLDHE